MIQTIEHEGKIFAVECACKERGGHNFADRMFAVGFDGLACAVQDTQCQECNLYPWIILPVTR
jgi:hypothetical protein